MRSSKYDKWVCIATIIIFLYSFFIIGASYVYCNELPYWGHTCREEEIVALEWSTAVFISPVAFLLFFFFMAFHRELEPVNRHWVKQEIRKGFKWLRWKGREGFKEYKKWKVKK